MNQDQIYVYAVFEGYNEMLYGYPPHLRGLFATADLAEEALLSWRGQAKERPEDLYVAPLRVQVAEPTAGRLPSLGRSEWPDNDEDD